MQEVRKIDLKSYEIAKELKLDSRMQKYKKTDCFITLKDHKVDFKSHPECRLINTAKNDLGKVVKTKVELINSEIRYATGVNQWQNTQSALDWFNNISDPKSYAFVKFDIVSFYPSIKPTLLQNAIKFAKSIVFIPKSDEEMIMQCRQSFLFFLRRSPMVKKRFLKF